MKKLLIAFILLPLYFLFSPQALASEDEVVCTPVYGMANTCAEHAVVDTGLDTGSLLNASALSYILGLAAFIKAKRA